jgi:hypothetical protein
MRYHEIIAETTEQASIQWEMPRSNAGYTSIWIDVGKLDASWRLDREHYVSSGGGGAAIGQRYQRFGEWVQHGHPVEMPEVYINPHYQRVQFGNGRHRFAWMRDHGVISLPVCVDVDQRDAFEQSFGMKQPTYEAAPSLIAAVRDPVSRRIARGIDGRDIHARIGQRHFPDHRPDKLDHGFINHKGHYLDRVAAFSYAADNGLLNSGGEYLHKWVASSNPKELDSDHLRFTEGRLVEENTKMLASAAFKWWFAQSKVVDADGRPLRVFHGTNQAFSKFSKTRLGFATQHPTAREAFFFTDQPNVAADYAQAAGEHVRTDIDNHERRSAELKQQTETLERIAQRSGKAEDWAKHEVAMQAWEELEIGSLRDDPMIGQNIVPVYLRLIRPLVLDANGGSFINVGKYHVMSDAIADAQQQRHDGLIIHNLMDAATVRTPATHYAVFAVTQIKSAI